MNKLVEELIKPILEADSKIKKIIGVYGGRFQPFGPHHLKTYKWLERQVDDAYITTSDIKKPPKHPMNYKEKVRHMANMGVPSNKIIFERSPFVAKNLTSKFDPETTAVIYVFGAKDTGRLGGGKYFQDYKKNKRNLKGYEEHGYYLVAPHVSMSAGGKEVSGTTMRELLGSPKIDDKERKKLFKGMFGYYNQGIFNMMTNKFKKLFEIAEGLPTRVKDKFKKVKMIPGSDIEKTFIAHHAGSMGAGSMGNIAEPDTYDWDDSGKKHNIPGHQTTKNPKKIGYEPVKKRKKAIKMKEQDINIIPYSKSKKKPKDDKWFDGKNRDVLFDDLLDEGIKDKLKKVFVGIKKEMKQNKKLGKVLTKYVRQGGKLSSSDLAFAKQQFLEALKLVGLTGIVLVPFGKFSIPVLVKVAEMVGMDLLPSSFRESIGLALPDGTINGSPQHPSQKKGRKKWEDEEEEHNKFMGDKKYQYNEAYAVRGSKVEKFITGHNLTHKGRKYKQIDFETIKIDNTKGLVTLRILAPKKLFGQETPVTFKTLRRGPFLKTDTSKKVSEDINIDLDVGDTVLMGKFKNKKVVVKDIEWNEKGDLLINGRPATKWRMHKKAPNIPSSPFGESIDECITVAKMFNGDMVLGKNRDRNYKPKLKIVRDRTSYGVEVCYVVDVNTDWTEGINELGVGVVNSALFVKRDEKDYDKAKKKMAPSKDGVRVREALGKGTFAEAVRSLATYHGGIKGHTTVGNGKKIVTIENTSRTKPVVKIKNLDKEPIVRTNHGIEHSEAGYQRGNDKLSSELRMINALNVTHTTNNWKNLFPNFYQHHQDKGPKYDLVRAQNKLWTSSQLAMNLNTKEMILYLIPDQVQFVGVENHLPKGYEPKIKIKVVKHNTDNGVYEAVNMIRRDGKDSGEYRDYDAGEQSDWEQPARGENSKYVNQDKIKKETLDEFISQLDIKNIIKEASMTGGVGADSGPAYAYGNFKSYRTRNITQAKKLGFDVVNYILTSGDEINPKEYRTYPKGPVPAVSYAPAGVGGGLTPNNQFDLVGDQMLKAYQSHIDKVATTVGMELVDYLYGIDPELYSLHFPDTKETKKESEIETPPHSKRKTKKEQHKEPVEIKESVFSKGWWGKELDLNEDLVKIDTLKPRKKDLLLMGGAYGHMAHPFDNKNLKFGDLKKIIELGLGGQLNREDGVTEKLDGQNIMISWKDGRLIAARNKGHIKNGGATALDAKGIGGKFAGRGNIADAFNFAMTDLGKAIGGLSQKQLDKIFDNGHNFMNMEVMWPASSNVIDYDVATLVFHGALKYNDNGDVIGEVPGSGRILQGMIQQINQHIQKKYSIGKPQFLTIPKHQDFGTKKKYFFGKLQKLQSQYGLKDNDTLSLYHQHYWQELIYNSAHQFSYKIPKKVLVGLTKRWAFFDKKYAIKNMKKDIKNKEFLEWALSYDSNDHKSQAKQNMKPFEILFFEVGAEILKNVQGFIAANPDKAVQGIKKRLSSAISNVRSGGDLKKLNTLKAQLEKLQAIGGVDSIVPSEGLVFKYKGSTYKFTGAFAPINQITGLISF